MGAIMKIKQLLALFGLLLTFAVQAFEQYEYEGVVSATESSHTILTIKYQQYRIDNRSVIHGVVIQGELAPRIALGQKVGFNIEQNADELPWIAEVWLLE